MQLLKAYFQIHIDDFYYSDVDRVFKFLEMMLRLRATGYNEPKKHKLSYKVPKSYSAFKKWYKNHPKYLHVRERGEKEIVIIPVNILSKILALDGTETIISIKKGRQFSLHEIIQTSTFCYLTGVMLFRPTPADSIMNNPEVHTSRGVEYVKVDSAKGTAPLQTCEILCTCKNGKHIQWRFGMDYDQVDMSCILNKTSFLRNWNHVNNGSGCIGFAPTRTGAWSNCGNHFDHGKENFVDCLRSVAAFCGFGNYMDITSEMIRKSGINGL